MNNQIDKTKSKVVCAFAGLGKTTIGKKYKNVCDLQSSPFRYEYATTEEQNYENMKYTQSKKRNVNWPSNYVCALKEVIKKYDLIFVPSNQDIRDLLVEHNIDFIFVLPSYNYRNTLLERYKNRGNPTIMINEVMDYFDTWSREQKDYLYPIYVLDANKSLEDLMIELGYIKEDK